MASEYIHKVLTIRLRFESPDVKKKELNISSPASGDWDKKLSSLLSKIAKKFKLSDMNASEWTISINNTIIDKSDANQLKQVLSLIPPKPIPIVEIIKTIKSEKFYIITVHYEEKQFDYKIKKETDESDSDESDSEWDEEIYQQLQAAIRTEFELDSEFVLYQNIGGTEIEIDDVDDLTDALYDTPDGQPTSTQLLHLFVKVQQPQIDKNALKIIYGNNSFDWRPANNEGDDEKEWEDNYTTLINKINSEYFINNIKLQQMQNAVDIDDGEELMETWQELVDDEDNYILEIRISGDLIQNELEGDGTNDTKSEEGESSNDSGDIDIAVNAEYKQWFRDVLGLPQYYQQFVDAGYENVNYLDEYIDEDELINDMGIKKKPHRRRILKEIKKLLQNTDINVPVVGQPQLDDVKKEPIKQSENKPIADRNDKQIEAKEPGNDEDDDKDKELELEEKEEMSMEEELSSLGSKIGSLPSKKQKLCFKTITSIKEQAQPDDEDAASQFQMMLGPISEKESDAFVKCVVGFLKILGYSILINQKKCSNAFKISKKYNIQTSKNAFKISGKSTKSILSEVSLKFRHLVDAMQDPSTDIYQDLKLKIPNNGKVYEHETGVYDNRFIIFELAQILMESQQTSLVNKTVLYPQNLERFINFLAPECSKNLCKDIYFDKLEPLKLASIGLFGSREEVLNMLVKYNTISKSLYDALIKDETNELIQCGIHAVLPINLHQNKQNIRKWDKVIYLFYWSLNNSFDMEKMKAVRKMRKDPSCLLSRVLYEISSTVCIQVSSAELTDFGVMKIESMGDDQAYEDDDDGIETITFCLEETKENHIMCQAADTNIVPLKQYSKKHGVDCDDLFILNGIYLSGYVRLFTQKARTVQDTKTWTVSSKNTNKLYEKIKLLDSKWKIEWDKNLSNADKQKYMIVEAILPGKYQQYKNDKKELRTQKMKELNDSVLEKEAETILESREKLILIEYCNFYINRCKSSHQKLITIINELGDSLWKDLYAVIGYIDMKYTKVSLQYRLDYNEQYWQKKKINELFDGMEQILRTYKREIEKVHINCEKNICEIKREKKPKSSQEKGFWDNVRGVFVERDEEEIRLSKMTKVEWEHRLQLKIDAAVKKAQRFTVKQNNVTIQRWLDRFQSKYNEYKDKVYHSFLSKYKIKNNVKTKITKINQQRLDKLEEQLFQHFKVYQNKKKRNTKIATINKISVTNASYWSQSSTRYELEYCIPKTIPPTYDMQFHRIDLATFDIEEMKISQQRNMNYEMPQTSKLLFHHVINNEVIMFIRTDNEENKSSETRIVVSNNSTLTSDSVRMALKRKRVINVTFFEKQKIFAILFEDELKFAKLHDGGRVAFTEKGCDLSETTTWWHSDIVIDAVLMQQDDNNNLFVWFVDSKHYLRAFDYDTNDWEPSKDFNLDQKYNSYILSPEGSFLVAFKPQYEEDEIYTPGNEPLIVEEEEEESLFVEEKESLIVEEEEQVTEVTEPQLPQLPHIAEPVNEEKQTVDPDDELEAKDELKIESKSDDEETKSENESELNDEVKEEPIARTATGRIQLHVFLLAEKRKLTYKIHSNSLTGYETGFEQELKDDNRDDLDIADNVLLPPEFSIGNVHLDRLSIQSTTKKDAVMLCAVNSSNKLLLHPLHIQVSDEKLKISEQVKQTAERKITKLDYMEYMIEKFGSRAAIFYPHDAELLLHTTYIMKDENKDADNLCGQISEKICKSLYDKEKKHFKWLNWKHNVLDFDDKLSALDVISATNNASSIISGDTFIKNLIMQIPVQIARGVNNKFQLMHNGEDNQKEYIKAPDPYTLCKAIRFGAYDGLIKSWKGAIKIVTSMGKQSTGKSYMLNHLFGTKFDISGGRCTDGAWLTVRIIKDVLYILGDFEGLGSFERSAQEDMLLATFNAALSSCTIFKCDNRFDRTVEDMFQKFQQGVKIMSGSQNCFGGKLLLIIKDVVDTGADAAKADFKRHIVKLAQESPLIKNEQTQKKQSTFFVDRMYKSGLGIVAYPPLATEKFFTKLNTKLEPAINKIKIIHGKGGNAFLEHIKLMMSKLNIGDFAAMNDEHAKMRTQEIRKNLKNAIETGSIKKTPNKIEHITFKVDDEQNLLILEGNVVLAVDIKEVIANIKNFEDVIKEYSKFEENIEQQMFAMVENLGDAGLILGLPKSLKFLYEQFCVKIERNHANFKEWSNLLQLFLDIIYWRRKMRVNLYINKNTEKFKKLAKDEILSLVQSAETSLNGVRDKMKLCKRKCNKCFFLCLLCNNHEDIKEDEEKGILWDKTHSCYQENHKCKLLCTYCMKNDGIQTECDYNAGHSSEHNCGVKDHTCGKTCSLSKYGGCQEKCNLESGHDKEDEEKAEHRCNAETHYCKVECRVPVCHNPCKMAYNAKDHQHICINSLCPYKCQVKCWSETQRKIIPCGRDCSCGSHDHHLNVMPETNMDELHICDQEHPCGSECNEPGNCSVQITQKFTTKTLRIGNNKEIKYQAHAEANAKKKRCCKTIQIGKFRHGGVEHRCYSDEQKDKTHTCTETCDSCGYYCSRPHGHWSTSSLHNCQHGNMRHAIFYAQDKNDVIDTGVVEGQNRSYKAGDEGTAEMCNMFCQRLGRGHIHLEKCTAIDQKTCEDIQRGKRHESKKYFPDPDVAKDEIRHSLFWAQKKWEDPCVNLPKAVRDSFDLCNFACSHPSHQEEEKKKGEEDLSKFCVQKLWHKPYKSSTGHHFLCSHPFGAAHVVFVCDISGSMSSSDGNGSKAQYPFIKNSGRLDNRLGALYSAIHKFLDIRLQKGCADTVSAVMTPGHPKAFAAKRVTADFDFVKKHLLLFKPYGGENYGQAFRDAKAVINVKEETVVIFLTDGYSSDNGAKAIVTGLRNTMKNKFKLICITLGPNQSAANTTVVNIKEAADGTMVKALSGTELGTTFKILAKQMNTGVIGRLK